MMTLHRRRLFWKNRMWNMGGRECEKAFSIVLFWKKCFGSIADKLKKVLCVSSRIKRA